MRTETLMANAKGSASDSHGPCRRADAARNRAKVLEVARRRILDGDTALPMNTISKEAGVGVGTVYRHFPTRHDLLEAVADGGVTKIVEGARSAAAQADPAVGFEQFMCTALTTLLDDPAVAELISSPALRFISTRPLGQELQRLSQVVVERAVAAGLLRSDVVGDDLRRLLVGLHAAVTSDPLDEHCSRRLLTIVMNGLRPDVGNAGRVIAPVPPR
jgi:AcrR family transcriptional regulator